MSSSRAVNRDSPTGDIRSFDFSAHLHRLEHTAVEAKAVELVFYSGRRFSMEPERYRAAMEDLFWEYGTLRRIRYLPENEAALGPDHHDGASVSKGLDAEK